MTAFIRQHYTGKVIACGGYTFNEAELQLEKEAFDAVAIGRRFIANPDLIDKLRHRHELVPYDVSMLDVLD